MNPHHTVFDAKRLIGRKFEDAEVQSDMERKLFPSSLPNQKIAMMLIPSPL
jgi:L1 cell adhesion molecule like protein